MDGEEEEEAIAGHGYVLEKEAMRPIILIMAFWNVENLSLCFDPHIKHSGMEELGKPPPPPLFFLHEPIRVCATARDVVVVVGPGPQDSSSVRRRRRRREQWGAYLRSRPLPARPLSKTVSPCNNNNNVHVDRHERTFTLFGLNLTSSSSEYPSSFCTLHTHCPSSLTCTMA